MIDMQERMRFAVVRIVARHYDLPLREVLGDRRLARVVRVRQRAAYLLRQADLGSYPEIAATLGDIDHTTVLHAVRKVTADSEKDPSLKEELDVLLGVICETLKPVDCSEHAPAIAQAVVLGKYASENQFVILAKAYLELLP